jgi:hypothetical protein
MAPDALGVLNAPSLEDIFANRAEAQEQAKAAMTLAAEHMKWYFDLHKSEVPFKVGDKVLLKGADLKVRTTLKLAQKNYGPYEIIVQPSAVNFRLKLPQSVVVHPVFHASKFIPFHEDTIADRIPKQPDPISVEGHEEFEVEQILDSQVQRRKIQYLVRWAGYDESNETWEPLHNLKHAHRLIKRFHQENPDAPEPISMMDTTPIQAIFSRGLTGVQT